MPREYTRYLTVIGNVPIFENVIYFNDFKGNILRPSNIDGFGTVEVTPEKSMTGKYSLHIQTDDTTDGISVFLPIPVGIEYFIRCMFHLAVGTNIQEVLFHLAYDDSQDMHHAYIRYHNTGTGMVWQYMDANWNYQTIANAPELGGGWHFVSFSVDFLNDLYRSLETELFQWTPSSIEMPVDTGGSYGLGKSMKMKINLIAQSATRTAKIWIDNILITTIGA